MSFYKRRYNEINLWSFLSFLRIRYFNLLTTFCSLLCCVVSCYTWGVLFLSRVNEDSWKILLLYSPLQKKSVYSLTILYLQPKARETSERARWNFQTMANGSWTRDSLLEGVVGVVDWFNFISPSLVARQDAPSEKGQLHWNAS